MTIAQYQQNTALNGTPRVIHGRVPAARKRKMLRISVGPDRYGIDLNEATEVIRDLLMIQSCNPKSMTRRFVKCNRRNTIVFNLEECLSCQDEGKILHKPASFVMLDERLGDSCVGILVPGIPSAIAPADSAPARGPKEHHDIPVHEVKSSQKKARDAIPVIDLRELVENCLIRLRYYHSHPGI
ncbi:MAG: hypothetical protein WC586_03610 [Methanoregula sp.]